MATKSPDPERWAESQGAWSIADPGEGGATPARAGSVSAADRYVVGGVVGRGAMGVVRSAWDQALGREVALKELDPALREDAAAITRMAREAVITARLDHPGVVAVHEAGILPDGRPFYTMRLVRGRSLAHEIVEAPDAPARRALLRNLLAAAEAVAAAHAAGVVHRDLKPSNLLIGAHGETQVVDWGMAAPTPARAADWASLPGVEPPGAAVGTPAYVAPEQAAGAAPDPRHDVWSLGATLYELIAGRPPVEGASDLRAARAAVPRPLLERCPDAPPELAAIVARAMAPSLEERYPDARAFADDLLAWFEGRRVSAMVYRPADLLRRLASAWRVPLIVAAVGLVAVGVAVARGWWGTRVALDRAIRAEAEATEARQVAETQLARNWVEQAVAALLMDDRARAETLASRSLALREDPLARGVLASFARARRPSPVQEIEGPSCRWAALAPDASWLLCGEPDRLSRWDGSRQTWSVPLVVAYGAVPELTRATAWDSEFRSYLIDAATGTWRAEPSVVSNDWVPSVAPQRPLLPDGLWRPPTASPSGCASQLRLLAARADGSAIAGLCSNGTLLLGPPDAPGRRRLPTEIADDHTGASMLWTPDGRLLIGTLRGGLRLLDANTGQVILRQDTTLGTIGRLAISPDGALAAVAGTSDGVGLWDLRTGGSWGVLPARSPNAIAFAPDGALVVYDGAWRRWRPVAPSPYRLTAPAGLAEVALSPDGGRIALARGDGVVSIWRTDDGAHLGEARPGQGVIKAVAFSPDGAEILAASVVPPGVFRFAAEPPLQALAFNSARSVRRLAWRTNGEIVAADLHIGLSRWATVGADEARVHTHTAWVDLERVGADELLVLRSDGALGWLGSADDAPRPLSTVPNARAAAGGGDLVVVALDTELLVLDRSGAPIGRLQTPTSRFQEVAVSPDGRWIAGSRLDGRVLVWDRALALRAELPGHTERVVGLEFSADSQMLVSASWDRSARLWGLSVLDRAPESLRAEIVSAWGDAIE